MTNTDANEIKTKTSANHAQEETNNSKVDSGYLPKTISRLATVQFMYMIQLRSCSPDEFYNDFISYIRSNTFYKPINLNFFHSLVSHFRNEVEVDTILQKSISMTSILDNSVLISSILKVSAIELLYESTPPASVINEYVEISKFFVNTNEVKLINALLDKISKHISEHKENYL